MYERHEQEILLSLGKIAAGIKSEKDNRICPAYYSVQRCMVYSISFE
jgi:hypothetical protein